MAAVLSIIGAYILGSIPFALLITRLFGIEDIRKVGSGNIGATNAWRAAGPAAGILVTVFDIGKGVMALLLVSIVNPQSLPVEYIKLMAGMAAILGHIFPVFLMFRGGKGVNTALGVMLTLLPIEALIALFIFIITVTISRYISLGSILGSITFFSAVLVAWAMNIEHAHPAYLITSFVLMLLIVISHRSNIRRLLAGNENKFHVKSGKTEGAN